MSRFRSRARALVSLPVVLCALLLAISAGASAETARGFVFEDLDGDGVRDDGEPGIPEVRVSNGVDIVQTAADGAWQLEVDDAAVIFLTKPAGWATPVDGRMLPRFYHVHQPAGSPEGLRYPGLEPTGPLPESIDFALRRSDEPSRFSALLFADTQPQSAAEVDFIRDDVVAELIGTDARFGMTLGDIMYDDLSLLPRLLSIVAQIGIPWYNVPGNHELNLDAADDAGSLETFKRFFGPPYYSFEVGDAVFFVLDNIFYQGGGVVTADNVRGGGGYIAKIDEEQMQWLENELRFIPPEKLLFLAMHSPLETYVSDSPGVNTANRRELFALLEGRPNLYAVAGHTHTTEHRYFDEDDGFSGPEPFHHHVLATVSGSWWSGPLDERGVPTTQQRDGTPNGYHVLEVDGARATVAFRAAGFDPDHQMRIVFDVAHHRHRAAIYRDFREGELLQGRISVDEVAQAAVYVNVFDGGPRTEVTMRVSGAPAGAQGAIEMLRVDAIDPFVQEQFARHVATRKSWVEPIASSHLWRADLPDDLGPGTYTVSVEVVDEFGRRHHGHRVLEVAGSSAPPGGTVRYP